MDVCLEIHSICLLSRMWKCLVERSEGLRDYSDCFYFHAQRFFMGLVVVFITHLKWNKMITETQIDRNCILEQIASWFYLINKSLCCWFSERCPRIRSTVFGKVLVNKNTARLRRSCTVVFPHPRSKSYNIIFYRFPL